MSCTTPFQPHPHVPRRMHTSVCRLPALPWPGCFLPAGASQHNVPLLCWGQRCRAVWQEDSTLSSRLLLGLRSPEYGGHYKMPQIRNWLLDVWSAWQAPSSVCLTFGKGSRSRHDASGTLWLSLGSGARLTQGTSSCKSGSHFFADLGLHLYAATAIYCCLGYLMDAFEKLQGNLQERSTHADLPNKEGNRQGHMGLT